MPGEGVDPEKRATLRRFAALGATTSLAGLVDVDSEGGGETDARDAIIGYLTATPGAHFSKVRDDLKLGTGEAQHHLRRLVDAGAIESHRDGDYRRFFPAGQFTGFEQVALGYLRRSTPQGMIVGLLRDPEATGGDLADELDVSRPTISKHAAELERAGLLERDGGYELVRPATLVVLLVRYADSFGDAAAAFADDADDLISVDR